MAAACLNRGPVNGRTERDVPVAGPTLEVVVYPPSAPAMIITARLQRMDDAQEPPGKRRRPRPA